MRLLRNIKSACEDIWKQACNHKWKTLICVLVAVAGVVVGAVLFNVFSYSWWYFNRCDYATKLFDGGFGLFFSFLFWTAIFYLLLVCCTRLPQTKYLALPILFVAGLYCGANTAAAIACWSLWGILFAILVTAVESVGYLFAVICSCCLPAYCRTFRESFCDTKQSFLILLTAFLVKVVMFFVILRILTGLI